MVVLLNIPNQTDDLNLGCIHLAASTLTMLMDTILNRKYAYDVIVKADWTVIFMFMGLFVWLRDFQNTCFPFMAFEHLAPYMNLNTIEGVLLFSVFVIIGSNIFSNVPLVILIVGHISDLYDDCGPLGGLLLAWISTIAGNFTLIGSVANLIVAEKARSSAKYHISFLEYFIFGFSSTLRILYVCLPVVYFMGKLAAKI
ncbi:PREDICTED: putative transporter arsB [Amphimedon queenslandica]|uniref:Citrate transporter-like domain-containing protein n=1 Tax=Amphimedon queenslandica TaxID=400682 RepID=A0A1X7VKH7_AMPQE|nr:PREDICTED: putative transporter arsB [Amphimedon queenslandica]|eukprot:XP_011410016.1 PREDICTED: putative transporter arsB [Amphimedon queenslandica]